MVTIAGESHMSHYHMTALQVYVPPPTPWQSEAQKAGALGAWRLRGWWRSGQQQNLWGFHAHFRKKLAFGWGVQQLRLLARTEFNILKWSTSRKLRKLVYSENTQRIIFSQLERSTWLGSGTVLMGEVKPTSDSSCGKGPPDLVISRWTQLTCSQCVEKLPYPVDLTWNIFTMIHFEDDSPRA